MTGSGGVAVVEEKLQRAIVDLSAKQFDQLVVFLLQELGPASTVDFVPYDADADIDMRVTVTHPFLDMRYGVRLEQIPRSEPVTKSAVRALAANVQEDGLQTGVLISTGRVPDAVEERASQLGITTIDGAGLATRLITNELGFTVSDGSIALESSFWEVFRGQQRTDTIPSIEVPQADSIERLDQTLEAVASGNHDKAQIATAVSALSGESFDPRQADYYGTAGWLLGFLHKEYEAGGGGRPGRWGLTRLGKTYLELRQGNETERAARMLHDQIRQIEIIRRILTELQAEGSLRRDEIAALVGAETELGGTTVDRRTRTVVRWLEHLPAIATSGAGDSQLVRYEESSTNTSAGDAGERGQQWDELSERSDANVDADLRDEASILDDIVSSFDTPIDTEP